MRSTIPNAMRALFVMLALVVAFFGASSNGANVVTAATATPTPLPSGVTSECLGFIAIRSGPGFSVGYSTFNPPAQYVSYFSHVYLPCPSSSPTATPTPTATPVATATPTPGPPTPTPTPLAVNCVTGCGGSSGGTGSVSIAIGPTPLPVTTSNPATPIPYPTDTAGSLRVTLNNTPTPVFVPTPIPFPTAFGLNVGSTPIPVTTAPPVSIPTPIPFPSGFGVNLGATPLPVTTAAPAVFPSSFAIAVGATPLPVLTAPPVTPRPYATTTSNQLQVAIAAGTPIPVTTAAPQTSIALNVGATPLPVTTAPPQTFPTGFSIVASTPLPVTTAAPVVFPSSQAVSLANPLPIPTPAPTLVPIGSAGTYTYALGTNGYTQLSCDIENLDGTAVLSSYLAFDATNANKQLTSGLYLQGPTFSPTFSGNGQYVFSVVGAQFFDIVVTTTGATQNATILCNPRFGGDLPNRHDGANNLVVTIGGQATPIAVQTPAPAPTVVTNEVAVSNSCSTTPITANGVVQCRADANGDQAHINLRDSQSVGYPDTSGIFPDNPANVACNASNAGLPCSITVTSTIATVMTGVTGKTNYVMGLQVSNTGATTGTLSLYQGTGGQCASNQGLIYGPIIVPAGGGFVLPPNIVPIVKTTATGYGVCASSSAAGISFNLTAQFAEF